MKKVLIVRSRNATLAVMLLLSYAVGFAQKPVIDFAAIDNWVTVSKDGKISPNGKYVGYGIDHADRSNKKFILQSANGQWRKEMPGVSNGIFAENNNLYIDNADNNTIVLVYLGTDKVEKLTGVQNWRVMGKGKQEHLVCQLSGGLIMRNLFAGNTIRIDSVNRFWSADDGSSLVFTSTGKELYWYDLVNYKKVLVHEGASQPGRIVFDNQYRKFGFCVDSLLPGGKDSLKVIYSYDIVRGRLEKVLSDGDSRMPQSYRIEQLTGYCAGGNSVVVEFMKSYNSIALLKPAQAMDVCIWGYQDSVQHFFRSFAGLQQAPRTKSYKGMLIMSSGKLQVLENSDTTAYLVDDEYWLVSVQSSNGADAYWNPYVTKNKIIKLVDAVSGQERNLTHAGLSGDHSMWVSSSHQYMAYYDGKKKAICSYDVAAGITREVLNKQATLLGDDLGDEFRVEVFGWVKDCDMLIVGFAGDLYLVDVSGKKPPHCVTAQMGARENLTFSIVADRGEGGICTFSVDEEYVLVAFNRLTKTNSFYKATLNSAKPPRFLSTQEALYWAPGAIIYIGYDFKPIKAANAPVYLVKRMRADQSANFFATEDFKTFRQLSFVYPEKNYNWLKAELFNSQLPDSSSVQGILYKPENFDSTKRYPVIIHYYEKRSDDLHTFPVPKRTNGGFGIAWFVSRGYLVACIDIKYKVGWPGASANHCINACVASLSERPYVNTKKIGLYGHSWGGFETNYIVTHSRGFAAAVSSAGLSSLIESFGGTWGGSEMSLANYTINGQLRMGAAPWESPDLYVENSPVLLANRVETPMLLMHNINDGNVRFTQGRQFFVALQRCGKPSWLLQYDKSWHTISNVKQTTDFTTRVTQFFDHYLKEQPMPCWMASRSEAQLKSACTD